MTKIISEQTRKAGLDHQKIELHQKRVLEYTRSPSSQKYEITEVCSEKNVGIIGDAQQKRFLQTKHSSPMLGQHACESLVTVVLAAGAATRFFGSFVEFCEAVEEQIPELRALWLHKFTKISIDNFQNKIFSNLSYSMTTEGTRRLTAHAQSIHDGMAQLFSQESMKKWNEKVRSILDEALDASSAEQRQTPDLFVLEMWLLTHIVLEDLDTTPKALIPIIAGTETLLCLNMKQQIALCSKGPIYFVTGIGQDEAFNREIVSCKARIMASGQLALNECPTRLLTQGLEHSTIRFSEDGEPILDDDGRYSVVAGGHGEIVHLFDRIADSEDNAQCLHVRTIDNIFGTSQDALRELSQLAVFFFELKACVDALRIDLNELIDRHVSTPYPQFLLSDRGMQAFTRLQCLVERAGDFTQDGAQASRPLKIALEDVQSTCEALFCWPKSAKETNEIESVARTVKQLMRPLSVFGVVPIDAQDVGGIPVYAKNPLGDVFKVCIESSHISENDRSRLFQSGQPHGHFNSALVFVETYMNYSHRHGSIKSERVNFSELASTDVFLIAKKQHKGQSVLYHELAMFEILSHSEHVNSIFVEIPRSLFKPNKSILDLVHSSAS